MGPRDLEDLLLRLRQRDVEYALAAAHSLQQEREREGRLANAGGSVHQVETLRREAAAEDVAEPGDASRVARR